MQARAHSWMSDRLRSATFPRHKHTKVRGNFIVVVHVRTVINVNDLVNKIKNAK